MLFRSIESHIKKCIDQDFKPDLVIIDYVDLLRSKRTNRERKDEIDDIYVSTKALARELNIPIWSVSQVNRAGAKDDIIEGDKAAGSYDKIMITDVAISLSRKKEDKVRGTGRFHVMKNRFGQDGITFPAKMDTNKGIIEVYASSSPNGVIASREAKNGEVLSRQLLQKKYVDMDLG